MTLLGWYAFVGMPLLLALMVYGGIKLVGRDDQPSQSGGDPARKG